MLSLRKYSRYLLYIPLLVAAACSHPYHIVRQEARTTKIKDIAPDSDLVRFIAPYKAKMDLQMSEIIGRADTTLTKKQPECTLGNFMADAQLQAARKIDPSVNISVANYGGIRISYLTKGDIRLRNIYELMPFDNMLTIIEVQGSLLHHFCDHMASLGGWPVSGISYTIKDKKAVNILAVGQPIDEQAIYKLAISDYVANGGDNCDFLRTVKQFPTNIFIRDVLVAYVRELTAHNEPLSAHLENRVQNAQ